MKLTNTLCLIVLLFAQIVLGQNNSKIIRGKILIETANIEGINVTNTTSEKATKTNKNGEFYINAKAGDKLLFSAVGLESKYKIIDEIDLNTPVLLIKMFLKITQLKEVIIKENPNINAVSLGIVPPNIKRYTPAERHLYTATSGGGILPLDPILNWISGRTAMLKKEVQVEKNEHLLANFEALFEEKYYTQTLQIPSDYIRGFQYYCIENTDFADAVRVKNKTLVMFYIAPLAKKYNNIIANEK